MKVLSPMATGNGAYIIHKTLAEKLPGYRVCGYNPYWTLIPPALFFLCRKNFPSTIIHTTPDYASFFHKNKVPLITTFHNYVLDPFMNAYSSQAQRIHYKTDLKYFTIKALSCADTITSVSKFTARIIQQDLGFTGKIQVIYNGIDTNVFVPKHHSQQKIIKVLFSGNLTRRKGADLLPLIADRLHKNIKILFTSGLRTKSRLPESPQLQNIGNIPYSQMAKIYQEADILLFPTVREGFGLAAAEAMACGLPVVATDCSSLPELIIHGKGGYLCQLGNIDVFAARINELAASPKLRDEMGNFNRARVMRKFTMEQMIRGYSELFEEVLSR